MDNSQARIDAPAEDQESHFASEQAKWSQRIHVVEIDTSTMETEQKLGRQALLDAQPQKNRVGKFTKKLGRVFRKRKLRPAVKADESGGKS